MRPDAAMTPPMPGPSTFRDRLLSVMDRKDHPSYWRLMGPGAHRGQLLVHYRQEWGVYVRDFPIFLSRIHARCPVAEIRQSLAENLYEEETGRISGGGPHGELFLHMMEGLGFSRGAFGNPRLLRESRAYRAFLDETTSQAPWIVGLAVATIFVEGSRNDRAEIGSLVARGPAPAGVPARPRPYLRNLDDSVELLLESCKGEDGPQSFDPLDTDPLVVHHGLDPRFLELKRVHRKVEGGHRVSAWSAVLDHARSPKDRAAVVSALERALELWIAYRDGVGRSAGL